jgi:3-phenylpropionate/trans-cinnamate dioxygenase ferredoxin subunit
VKHELFPLEELEPGQLREAVVDGLSVVVARTPDGAVFALRAVCPHKGANLSHGRLEQQVHADDIGSVSLSDDFVLRCPWHGYEFDLATGVCPADPEHVRVRVYEVRVENGNVVLER